AEPVATGDRHHHALGAESAPRCDSFGDLIRSAAHDHRGDVLSVDDLLVHHRVDPFGAALGADGVQQQHGCALEVAADVSAVAMELVDHLLILGVHPFVVTCLADHASTSGTTKLSSESAPRGGS